MEYIAYLYEGKSDGKSDEMIIEAVSKYCKLKNIEFKSEKGDIKRGERGKPYVEGLNVHFNLSHSGEMAVCMVGEAPCGIDLQILEVRNYRAIAKKYYSDNEQAYVDKYGLEGFFRVWVHREAFGKLTGEGVLSPMPDFVDEEGYPKIEVTSPLDDRTAFIKDVPVSKDIFLAFATYGEDDEIRFEM